MSCRLLTGASFARRVVYRQASRCKSHVSRGNLHSSAERMTRLITTHSSSTILTPPTGDISIASSPSIPLSSSTTAPASFNHTKNNQLIRPFSTNVGAPIRKKVTSVDLIQMKKKGQKISMVTAYTYPSAVHVDIAGIDVILVGDSLGMVELGYDTTLPVTIEEMLYHCKAVSRGSERALLCADLPFGSYEGSPQQAYNSAIRFLKEAGMDCVKMEGGAGYAPHVRTCVNGGVAVMGHIGLTPQRISTLGGFRAQGKTVLAAKQLLEDALALQDAGCFSIVIECVPAEVAEMITRTLTIPTIGIGAGRHTSGQVLVYHDLLGMFQHAHHAKVSPSFCKTYGKIGDAIQVALNQYKAEVTSEAFPGADYSPYKLNVDEREKFQEFSRDYYAKLEAKKKKEAEAEEEANGGKKASSVPVQDETIKVY